MSNEFTIRFWGVRGSLPSPGPHTVAVGGNTACVEVVAGQTHIILDAGTGLRALGAGLGRRHQAGRIHILLSHLHGDHLMGLPFFAPLYSPKSEITIASGYDADELRQVLRRQMSLPTFPVDLDQVGARLAFRQLPCEGRFAVEDVAIEVARAHHPGTTLAYRLESGGRAVVYATDHEHGTPADARLVALARDADLLILDAQYTPEEYEGEAGSGKRGWGHSTYVATAELARAAHVKALALFHHDPARSDEEVAGIEARARCIFPASFAAREDLSYSLLDGTPEHEAHLAA
jgi:phosphoribosyl 1,2-cyclic phosphodiesterase